jgi:mono/diheme cytochrome c family protein
MLALIALLLVAAAPATPPSAAPDAALGEAVWTKRCAGCHGDDGKGDTRVGRKFKVADFSDPTWPGEWTQPKVEQLVQDGIDKKMPAWRDRLSMEEIRAVAQYARGLAKPSTSKAPATKQ